VSFPISMRDPKSHPPAPPPAPARSRARPGAEKGTISVHFVRAVVDAVRARGLEPEPLLRAAGISPELIGVPQARVSPAHYSALWRLVIARLDDEFFGQDSRRMKTGSFALMVRSVVHCTSLRAALDRAARCFGVFLDDVVVSITEAGDEARLTLHPCPAERPAQVFAHETLLVMVYGLACWLVGRRIPVLVADFAYAEPPYSGEYAAMFSNSMHFGQPATRLVFDAGMLDLPVVQSERTAKDFLRIAPENILLRYKNTQSLSARIRRRLRQALPNDFPELEAIAREFHSAPATLRRRLKAEGESYQAIKDEIRRDLAIMYLSTTDKSIREIALELGFLEPSAFHRAFRKWAHTSPGAYRRADLRPEPRPARP
jgi:AraC-like DNA-binding protein